MHAPPRRFPPASALAGLLTLAGALATPSAAAAQPAHPRTEPDSAARTHQVRRGETLWALAGLYLGSPFRWPVIREANADRVADPHWIYPGQWLRIPGMPPAAPDPAPGDGGVAAAPPVADETPAPAQRPSPSAAPTGADTAPRRPSDWYAAPYVGPRGALRGAGVIVDGTDTPSAGGRGTVRRFQFRDRVVLSLPAGARTDSGTAYVVAVPGPSLDGGDVVVPRGIVVLDGGGTPTLRTGRLVRMFGLVEAGTPVVPLVADPETSDGAAPSATRVLWVPGTAEQPTLQAYVLLGRGARDGVRVGDRFELVGDGRRTPEGAALPEVRIGIVRVVRVSSGTATAVVVHHDQPAIAPGIGARPLRP